MYGSSGILGTKGGGSMAAAWAVMHYLGDDGYMRVTAAARDACLQLAGAVRAIPQLEIRAEPQATLLAFGAADDSELDVFAVADALWRRGWYVDRQGPPPSLHCTVSVVHEGKIGAFVSDLQSSLDEVVQARQHGAQGAYGTVE
jgi:glutamate/tyrosine decarboxylase-like PLP-dependent enzyme